MNGTAAELDTALEAARSGVAEGFEGLFAALGPAVAAYLRARGVRDADDIANGVFLKAFRALHTFRGDGERFRSWLFTIAHHASIDELRSRRRRATETPLDAMSGEPGGAADEVPDAVMQKLAVERVEGLLAQLSPDQRDVLMLRVVADLTVEQTAAVLGKSYEGVKALQRRGLATLKRQLLSDQAVPRGARTTLTGMRWTT